MPRAPWCRRDSHDLRAIPAIWYASSPRAWERSILASASMRQHWRPSPRPRSITASKSSTAPRPPAALNWPTLADRIANRPDGASLASFRLVESHLPERAERFAAPGFGETPQAPLPPQDGPPGADARPPAGAVRPPGGGERHRRRARRPADALHLAPAGAPGGARRRPRAHFARVVDGARRRCPPPRPRDYYVVEDAEGRRYWLFREGLYGEGAQASPRWYVHGLFA